MVLSGGRVVRPRAPADRLDPSAFIRASLPLTAVPARADILLHLATPASGLSRLPADASASPYWAFCWGGGLAIARYLLDHRDCVRGRRVLDFGAGSGLVAIAAAKAGARSVLASEIDPLGAIAISLNAAANGVSLDIVETDLIDAALPAVDIVLAGDMFYDAALAARVTVFLDRCLDAGIEVLVGDPGRVPLPQPRLRELARYPVGDFGDGATSASVHSFQRLEADGNLPHLGVEDTRSPGLEPGGNGDDRWDVLRS